MNQAHLEKWHYTTDPHEAGRLFIETADEKVIAIIPTNKPEDYSRTQLMCAAPDLLEACKEALYGVDDDKAIEMIRKAISKAGGES